MLWWLLENTVTAGVLVAVVAFACRIRRLSPAVQHALWLIVLLKFLTPSVVSWPWGLPNWLTRFASGDFGATVDARSPVVSLDGGKEAGLASAPHELLRDDEGRDSPDSSFESSRLSVTSASATGDRPRSSADASAGPRPAAAAESEPSRGVDTNTDDAMERGDALDLSGSKGTTGIDGERPSTGSATLDWPLAEAARSAAAEGSGNSFGDGASVTHLDHAAVGTDRGGPHSPHPNRLRLCLLALWLTGVLATAVRQFWLISRSRRTARRGRAAPEWLDHEVTRVATLLRIRPPQTLVVSGIRSPVVWCLGRPRLLWPAPLASDRDAPSFGNNRSQVETGLFKWRGVITHELAHLRRRDHWVAWLELVAGCVWWWNPLFWYARRQLRESAELACDAWAVWAMPDDRRTYAEALVEVSSLVSQTRAPVPVLGVSTGARRAFQRRLTMILTEQVPNKLSIRGFVLVGVLALVALPSLSRGQQAGSTERTRTSSTESRTPIDSSLVQEPATKRIDREAGLAASAIVSDADGSSGDERVIRVSGLGNYSALALSPDGCVLATASGPGDPPGIVEFRDAATGNKTATTVLYSAPTRVAFAPDCATLAVADVNGGVSLLQLPSGTVKRTFSAHAESILALAFSSDGKLLASGGTGTDSTIRLWEVASGKETRVFEYGGKTTALAFSPDGKILAAGYTAGSGRNVDEAGQVILFDLSSKDVVTLQGHSGRVWSLAFSPDGKTLASGTSDNALKTWDVDSKKVLATLSCAAPVVSVAFSPAGHPLAAASSDGRVTLFEMTDRTTVKDSRTVRQQPGFTALAAFAPDGLLLVLSVESQNDTTTAPAEVARTPLQKSTISQAGSRASRPRDSVEVEFRVFALKHAQAANVRNTLIGVDDRTNSLIMRGSSDLLANAEAIIRTMDVPAEKSTEPHLQELLLKQEAEIKTLRAKLAETEAATNVSRAEQTFANATGLGSKLTDTRGQSAAAGTQLDLVTLGTTYIDAVGSMKLAKRQFERIERLTKNKTVSSDELDTASINLETAERKTKLLRGIAEAALASGKAESEWSQRLFEKGYLSAGHVAAPKAKLDVLELILGTKE